MHARKLFHLGLILLLTTLTLPGCGFQLRGSAQLPTSISPVHIQGLNKKNLMHRELAQHLEFSNITVADTASSATSLLKISDYSSDRRVLSVDGNGNVAEYELHEGARFELISTSGGNLVSLQQVSTLMTYLNSETEVLGKQQEEGVLRQDMRRDLAGQIMRRIQAQL